MNKLYDQRIQDIIQKYNVKFYNYKLTYFNKLITINASNLQIINDGNFFDINDYLILYFYLCLEYIYRKFSKLFILSSELDYYIYEYKNEINNLMINIKQKIMDELYMIEDSNYYDIILMCNINLKKINNNLYIYLSKYIIDDYKYMDKLFIHGYCTDKLNYIMYHDNEYKWKEYELCLYSKRWSQIRSLWILLVVKDKIIIISIQDQLIKIILK